MNQARAGKKIIFFDIDGTLVSHVGKSHIPEPTIKAVRELARGGHVPAIATGRNLALTRKTANFFDIGTVVCCNGAHVTNLPEGRDIYSAWLGDGFTRLFRENAFAVSSKAYALDAENAYTDCKEDFIEAFIAEQVKADSNKSLSALERAQAAYIFVPPPAVLMGHGGVDVIEAPDYTEFRPSGVSKWSGVLRAASDLGFDPGDVVVVGDALNDIEMVSSAPIGIAVGGADSALKAAADFVTDDIDEGGIWSAFHSLGMV